MAVLHPLPRNAEISPEVFYRLKISNYITYLQPPSSFLMPDLLRWTPTPGLPISVRLKMECKQFLLIISHSDLNQISSRLSFSGMCGWPCWLSYWENVKPNSFVWWINSFVLLLCQEKAKVIILDCRVVIAIVDARGSGAATFHRGSIWADTQIQFLCYFMEIQTCITIHADPQATFWDVHNFLMLMLWH